MSSYVWSGIPWLRMKWVVYVPLFLPNIPLDISFQHHNQMRIFSPSCTFVFRKIPMLQELFFFWSSCWTMQYLRRLLRFCPFGSPLLFLSFFFFSDCLFFSGVQQQAGRTRPMATQDGTGEQAGTTGTSSVTVFLPTLLFSSSHFYYLFCRKLQQQTQRLWKRSTCRMPLRGCGGRMDCCGGHTWRATCWH